MGGLNDKEINQTYVKVIICFLDWNWIGFAFKKCIIENTKVNSFI